MAVTTNPKRPAVDRLGRLYRMAGFYPRRHLTLRDALTVYAAALQRGEAPLEVRLGKGGYAVPDPGPGREGPHGAALRRQLIAHNVQELRFSRDASPDQLWRFLSAVALRPSVAAVAGGLPGALEAAEVVSVTVDGTPPRAPAAAVAEPSEEVVIPTASAPTSGSFSRGGASYEMFARPDAAVKGVVDDVDAAMDELTELDPSNVQAYRALVGRLVGGARQFESLGARVHVLRVLKFLAQSARTALGESREMIFAAVRQINRGTLVGEIVRALGEVSRDSKDRPLITRVLVMVGSEAAVTAAEMLGTAEDVGVRRSLLDTLVSLDRVGVPAADALPTEGEWYLLRNRVTLLGETRDALAIDEFQRTIRHADVRVRKETARAVAKIEGEDAVDLAIRALSDPDPGVRAAAAVTLGVRDEYYAFHALLHHVDAETSEDVLTEVIRSLGRHGNPSALTALGRVAQEGKTTALRVEAVRALGSLGRAALGTLKPLESDRVAEVRQATKEALRAAAKRAS
jgi:hypothetical protein